MHRLEALQLAVVEIADFHHFQVRNEPVSFAPDRPFEPVSFGPVS